ncbi:hypothetical protein BJX63DRAFT_427021 [Aspergillus granulosus]|uniref:NAD-dependent epimerase/dehydratase domain-containing protein n=1 Tax=Aspergillus granulosus TaxID=176169 RepID=A0ABR4I490_9EURO
MNPIPPRILFLGASGYIGGSVLDRVLKSADAKIKSAAYTVLVRKEEQAAKITKLGVTPVLFNGLDEFDLLRQQAAEHDIVINTADAFNTKAAEALILGLSDGQKKSGREAIYLHTSGTSSVGEYPVPESSHGLRVLKDTDDVYDHLVQLERKKPYAQRTTDVAVVDTGMDAQVKTYIVMSPTIYGLGSGQFNRQSIQVPGVIKRALQMGKAPVHGSGTGDWDHVHIDDLTDLYELILSQALQKKPIPSGRKGIYFNETGYHNWKALSERVASVGQELGALSTKEVDELDSEEWVTCLGGTLTPSKVQAGELGFASWSRTSAELGRNIGWMPKHGETSWEEDILLTFKAIWEQKRSG